MSTFWDSLVSAGEQSWAAESNALFPTAGLASNISAAAQPALAALDWLTPIKQNLAALAVGLGLFLIGSSMVAFSSFEDLADTAGKVVKMLPAAP